MARIVSSVFGAIFVVMGLLGFFQNPVLDLFAVNALHNVIHIVSGVLLLAVALWWARSAAWVLLVLGAVYAAVAILGFVMPDLMASLINNNPMDTWLHIGLAAVFIVAGIMGRAPRMPMSSPQNNTPQDDMR